MRLQNYQRDIIINAAVKSTFDKRKTELDKAEDKLGMECYRSVFDEKILRAAAKLPDGWLRTCDCLRFNVNGMDIGLDVKKEVRTPNNSNCGRLGVVTGDLANRVIAHMAAEERLKEERRALEKKLEGLIYSIGTIKRLKELWPEGAKFYAGFDEEAIAKGGLPAIRFDDVNEMLGLKAAA